MCDDWEDRYRKAYEDLCVLRAKLVKAEDRLNYLEQQDTKPNRVWSGELPPRVG